MVRSDEGLARRIGTVARWPIGAGLAFWRYLWRTSPVYREDAVGGPEDLPPPIDASLDDDDVRWPCDGAGPVHHRRYATSIANSRLGAKELIDEIARNPNRAAPVEVAVFRKTKGEPGGMQPGDEFVVRMPGPWDGPVRVVDRGEASFRLATLAGHLEAGQIEFRAVAEDDGAVRFEIESWASSGDRFSNLLYDRLRLAKEMQLHMWTHFCERVVRLSSGRMREGIHVSTRRVDEGVGADDAAAR